MKTLKLACVVGTRPNIIKMFPILTRLIERQDFEFKFIHTGQHTHKNLSHALIEELHLPEPEYILPNRQQSVVHRIADIMVSFERLLDREHFDALLITGDVDSTFACALTAYRCRLPVVHIEAGLRSFDMRMPEELNRIVTDRISSLLMVTEPSGQDNLEREGIPSDRIYFVGNVMIDTLIYILKKIDPDNICRRYSVLPGSFGIITLHRPENVDNLERLKSIMTSVNHISLMLPLIFPIHPRTKSRMENIYRDLSDITHKNKLQIIDPIPYSDMIGLLSKAKFVLTDSGGIQEETSYLGVPCITLRTSTERPVTITHGTNMLAGENPKKLFSMCSQVMSSSYPSKRTSPSIPLWDGHTTERILDIILSRLPRIIENDLFIS